MLLSRYVNPRGIGALPPPGEREGEEREGGRGRGTGKKTTSFGHKAKKPRTAAAGTAKMLAPTQ